MLIKYQVWEKLKKNIKNVKEMVNTQGDYINSKKLKKCDNRKDMTDCKRLYFNMTCISHNIVKELKLGKFLDFKE